MIFMRETMTCSPTGLASRWNVSTTLASTTRGGSLRIRFSKRDNTALSCPALLSSKSVPSISLNRLQRDGVSASPGNSMR
jgi:hypothetical protein